MRMLGQTWTARFAFSFYESVAWEMASRGLKVRMHDSVQEDARTERSEDRVELPP